MMRVVSRYKRKCQSLEKASWNLGEWYEVDIINVIIRRQQNSLPETVTRQRRDCDLNPGPSAPESSTLTTRLPSHPAAM